MEIHATQRGFRPAELQTAFFDTRFGTALIGIEPEFKRIAWLSLVLDNSVKAKTTNLDEMTSHWNPNKISKGRVPELLKAEPGDWIFKGDCGGLPLMMQGTDFQHAVWKTLTKIPMGETRSYSDVAEELNRPKNHARAIASAVAANTVAVLVPCHRVIQASGKMSGFRWGIARKRMLLDWEAAVTQNAV